MTCHHEGRRKLKSGRVFKREKGKRKKEKSDH